jgi:hypothetical protein
MDELPASCLVGEDNPSPISRCPFRIRSILFHAVTQSRSFACLRTPNPELSVPTIRPLQATSRYSWTESPGKGRSGDDGVDHQDIGNGSLET